MTLTIQLRKKNKDPRAGIIDKKCKDTKTKKKNQHKLLELRQIALREHIETHTLTNTKKNSSETTEQYADITKSDDVNEEKVLKHLTIDKNSVYEK